MSVPPPHGLLGRTLRILAAGHRPGASSASRPRTSKRHDGAAASAFAIRSARSDPAPGSTHRRQPDRTHRDPPPCSTCPTSCYLLLGNGPNRIRWPDRLIAAVAVPGRAGEVLKKEGNAQMESEDEDESETEFVEDMGDDDLDGSEVEAEAEVERLELEERARARTRARSRASSCASGGSMPGRFVRFGPSHFAQQSARTCGWRGRPRHGVSVTSRWFFTT